MVGVIDDASKIVGQTFRTEGDDIVLLGENTDEIGGSEYLYVTKRLVAGTPPRVDLGKERALQQAVLMMTNARHLNSARDCSDGGLACALAECAIGDGEALIGIDVTLGDDLAPVATLFAESQGRIVVSCAPEQTAEVLRIAEEHGVPAARIGSVTAPGSPFRIIMPEGKVEADLTAMAEAYFGALPNIMDAPSTTSA
jgi:phosphoribosylformylglycinamidine synthase